jgi:PAS domain S-box-containing protein
MNKILIVDDMEQNLELLEALLTGQGYEVIMAKDGEEALEKAGDDPPDLIISDILMPVMDGFQLCRKWKSDDRLKQIPFIFYTATYTDPKDEAFALGLGADLFLVKPMEPDLFLNRVEKVISQWRRGRITPTESVPMAEEQRYKKYSERLIKKLKKKLWDLEKEVASREKAEKALCESEERFRRIFFNSPDVFAISRMEDGLFVDINEGFTAITGYTREETIGKTSLELNILTDSDDRQRLITALQKSGRVQNLEAKFQLKDGTVFTGLTSATAITLDDVPHILSSTRSIEDMKQAEEAVQQKARDLAILYTLSQEVRASHSLDQVVKSATEGIVNAVNTDLALLFLREGERLFLKWSAPENPKFTSEETPVHSVGECLCGLAVTEGQPIYSLNIHNDPRCTWSECKRAGLHSFAALPLQSGDQIIGVLGLASVTERNFEGQVSFLETLSNQISIGLQNALLHDELERNAAELEERVAERTTELEKKRRELERFNKLFVDRELRMIELKKEIKKLREKS